MGMSNIASAEILLVLVVIIVIIMILKEKRLSTFSKILWILSILVFNFLALICFFIWMSYKNSGK